MNIFHDWRSPQLQTPTVLTMGVFNSLHVGHQTIIRRVVERAAALACTPTVVTFDPHPRAVLYPETAPPLLQTLGQRLEALRILGIRQTLVLPFNRELAALSATEFARTILFTALRPREIHLGENFVFGRARQGNITTLRCLGADYGCAAYEVEAVLLRGKRVSSTLLREAIQAGRVNWARRMLMRPYGVEGEVVVGRRLGRTINFPTANIAVINRVLPTAFTSLRRLSRVSGGAASPISASVQPLATAGNVWLRRTFWTSTAIFMACRYGRAFCTGFAQSESSLD